jgi:hypothetical protein
MPAAGRPMVVPFPPPVSGLSTVTARSEQPARASFDLRNVTGFGVDGRMRIQVRDGTLPLLGQANVLGFSNTNRQILALHEARFLDGSSNSASYVVAVAATDIYQITPPSGTNAATITLAAAAKFNAGRRVRCATMGAYTFLLSGFNTPQKLKLDDGTVSDWTASTAGTLPTGYRLLLAARGRVWMAGNVTNPNDWTVSRQGDPFDWDFTADDVGGPVEGNSGFRGGQVGEPINAIMAGKDDTILFGTRNQLFELQGEPTLGSLLVRSTGVGVLTAESWCMGASGEIYFVGTAGFYKLPVGGAPQPLNIDKVQTYFSGLGDTGYWVSCVWDPERFGVHIFITPPIDAVGAVVGTSAHLFYNARTDGFEPRDYPEDHGPICAIFSDTGAAGERRILMGGRKGHIMYPSTTAFGYDASSSGTIAANVAIASRATYGPVRPSGPADRAKMIELSVTLGEAPSGFATSDFRCDVAILAGKSPYDAFANPTASATATLSGVIGRQVDFHRRLRGNTFYVQCSNSTINKGFSIDECYGRFLPAGRES